MSSIRFLACMYNRVDEVSLVFSFFSFPFCSRMACVHHALDVGSLFMYSLTLLLTLIPPTPEKQL